MRGNRHTLIALILFSAALHFAGIRGDLPYAENYDERPFVGIPYFLAVEGKWDPHYYGHPGSTMIYPLRMVFSVWISIAHSDDFMQLRSLDDLFLAHPSEYFYFGRFLSILYGIGATAALYLIARRLFGETTALWGTVLWLLSPLILEHHQIARTDAAALCFASWAVLAILRLVERPNAKNRWIVAAFVALAISSHFKMVWTGLLWIVAEFRILRDASPSEKARAAGRAVLAGIGSFAMFVVMNPYIFLNWSGFRECIEVENRSEHAGADGLSRWGNLAWYVTEAIPSQPDGWFLLILGAIGAARYLAAGRFEHRLWILGAGLYTLEICAAHLHWERWIMPLLPVLAYLSIDTVIWLAGRLPETTRRAAIPVALAIALVSPARQTTLHEIQQICRSTRVRSLEWILANVPKGSPILVEWYSAPVRGQGYPYREVFALPEMPPVRLLHQQYRYVVTSTSISGRYLGDPARHAAEIAYYRDLRSQQLVAKFTPSRTVGGSTIEIYKLRPPS